MNHRSHKKSKKRSHKKGGHCRNAEDSTKENNAPPVGNENDTDVKNFASNNGKKHENAFEIESSDIMGRYMVATRNLNAGDIIVTVPPIVIGPCTGCDILCLGCYHKLTDIAKCEDCGWPLCSNKCAGKHTEYGHSKQECELLKKAELPDYKDLRKIKEYYFSIVPLRCLLLRESDPVKWTQMNEMVAHNEVRKKLEVWKFNQINIVDRIIKTWKFTQYSEELIHTICGILEVNAFEIGQYGISIRGIFPTAYLIAHDCVPNTTHTDNDDHVLTVRASKHIAKGEIISLSYAYTLQGTLKRREHLKQCKFFDCCCKRCADPTELGTFVSALNCPKCATGCVLPLDPLNNSSQWKCHNVDQSQCPGYTVTTAAVKLLLERITDEYEAIDANDVAKYENFLKKYRNVLHRDHYLLISVKHSLSQLYGKTSDYMIQNMSEDDLKRKITICREILKIFDILEPGFSRLRGITMYELHAPLMILITREFETGTITKVNLKLRLKEVVSCLKESSSILAFEPKNSSEGVIASAATEALTRIKDWEKIIGKI